MVVMVYASILSDVGRKPLILRLRVASPAQTQTTSEGQRESDSTEMKVIVDELAPKVAVSPGFRVKGVSRVISGVVGTGASVFGGGVVVVLVGCVLLLAAGTWAWQAEKIKTDKRGSKNIFGLDIGFAANLFFSIIADIILEANSDKSL